MEVNRFSPQTRTVQQTCMTEGRVLIIVLEYLVVGQILNMPVVWVQR